MMFSWGRSTIASTLVGRRAILGSGTCTLRCSRKFAMLQSYTPSGMLIRKSSLVGAGLYGAPAPRSRGAMMAGAIAAKLRVLREERSLTQKEAAELAHVHLETLRRLESGERPPYMPTLTKIARGYGVSIEEVVEGG